MYAIYLTNATMTDPKPSWHSEEPLVLLLAIFIFVMMLIVTLKRRDIVYPELHRNALSPAAYISKKSKSLPPAVAKPVVVEHGSRAKPVVALTFDADMTPAMLLMLKQGIVTSWYNRAIKDTLDREHVKATVFLGGLWTKTYPLDAKALAIDPLIEIGNHSYNHYAFANSCYNLPVIANSQDKNDVSEAQAIIKETTGVTPKYFRFPGGCYDGVDVETIASLGLTVVHWDVVAGDGFNLHPASIVAAVESQAQNGSIIVMHIHDGTYAPKTNEALIQIVPDLRRRGFQFVTISELLAAN